MTTNFNLHTQMTSTSRKNSCNQAARFQNARNGNLFWDHSKKAALLAYRTGWAVVIMVDPRLTQFSWAGLVRYLATTVLYSVLGDTPGFSGGKRQERLKCEAAKMS